MSGEAQMTNFRRIRDALYSSRKGNEHYLDWVALID